MLFNSFEFLLFFPAVVALYFLLPYASRWFLLLAASCFFYMYFKPEYILILLVIIVIDFYAAKGIEATDNKRKKKWFLILSISSNLLILAIFKYYGFFNENVTGLYQYFGRENPFPELNIILPVGLSFHTFQAMGYTIDVYRGNFKAQKHFGIYALYEMFFPQLVAGPIERSRNIIPQFYEKHDPDPVLFSSGLRIMLWGFFKKMVIADNLSPIVDKIYNSPVDADPFALTIATLFFTIQIYCDFSGYSDIAVGSARIMGFRMMRNFNFPYIASSFRDFWNRWHISLSSWFRDYLYIPLGGSRKGEARTMINLFLVFAISGLWHGANWTFMIWGILHGTYLVIERIGEKSIRVSLPKFLRQILVFLLVVIAWVYFRADTIGDGNFIVKSIFGMNNEFDSVAGLKQLGIPNLNLLLLILFALSLFVIFETKLYKGFLRNFIEQKKPLKYAAYFMLAICIIVFGNSDEVQFIYFQF